MRWIRTSILGPCLTGASGGAPAPDTENSAPERAEAAATGPVPSVRERIMAGLERHSNAFYLRRSPATLFSQHRTSFETPSPSQIQSSTTNAVGVNAPTPVPEISVYLKRNSSRYYPERTELSEFASRWQEKINLMIEPETNLVAALDALKIFKQQAFHLTKTANQDPKNLTDLINNELRSSLQSSSEDLEFAVTKPEDGFEKNLRHLSLNDAATAKATVNEIRKTLCSQEFHDEAAKFAAESIVKGAFIAVATPSAVQINRKPSHRRLSQNVTYQPGIGRLDEQRRPTQAFSMATAKATIALVYVHLAEIANSQSAKPPITPSGNVSENSDDIRELVPEINSPSQLIALNADMPIKEPIYTSSSPSPFGPDPDFFASSTQLYDGKEEGPSMPSPSVKRPSQPESKGGTKSSQFPLRSLPKKLAKFSKSLVRDYAVEGPMGSGITLRLGAGDHKRATPKRFRAVVDHRSEEQRQLANGKAEARIERQIGRKFRNKEAELSESIDCIRLVSENTNIDIDLKLKILLILYFEKKNQLPNDLNIDKSAKQYRDFINYIEGYIHQRSYEPLKNVIDDHKNIRQYSELAELIRSKFPEQGTSDDNKGNFPVSMKLCMLSLMAATGSCKTMDSRLAVAAAAFQRLQTIGRDDLQQLRTPITPNNVPNAALDEASIESTAWRTAYALATTPSGYDTLLKINPSLKVTPDLGEGRKLREFLVAAHQLTRRLTEDSNFVDNDQDVTETDLPTHFDPESLLKYANDNIQKFKSPGEDDHKISTTDKNCRLLSEAIVANHRLLNEKWNDLVEENPRLTLASTAVRNGIFEYDGPQGLDQVIKHSDRQQKWIKDCPTKIDGWSKRLKATLKGSFLVYKDKNPFAVALTTGSRTNLGGAVGESKANSDVAAILREAYLKQAQQILQSVSEARDDQSNTSLSSDDRLRLVDCLVRAAILKIYLDRHLFRGVIGLPLEVDERRKLEDILKTPDLVELLGVSKNELDEGFKKKLLDILETQSRDGDVDDKMIGNSLLSHLNKTYDDLSSPEKRFIPNRETWHSWHKALPGSCIGDEQEELRFQSLMKRLEGQLEDVRVKQKKTKNDIVDAIAKMPLRMHAGSKHEAQSGYNWGFTGKALRLSYYFPPAAFHPRPRVGPDLTVLEGKDAFMEFSVGGHAFSFRTGLKRKKTASIGVNGGFAVVETEKMPFTTELIGSIFDNKGTISIGAQASFGVGGSKGKVEEAVAIRLNRTADKAEHELPANPGGLAWDEGGGKEEFSEAVRTLLNDVPERFREKGLTSPIEVLMATNPRISITLQSQGDIEEVTLRGGLNAGALATFGLGESLNATASLGLASELRYQPESLQRNEETSGSLQIIQEKQAQSFRLDLQLGLGATAVPLETFRAGTNLVSAGVNMINHTMQIERNIFFVNGEVDKWTALKLVHTRREGFRHAVKSRLEHFAKAAATRVTNKVKKAVPGGSEIIYTPREGDEEFQTLVKQEEASILQWLEDLPSDPAFTYCEYFQIAPEAKKKMQASFDLSQTLAEAGLEDEADHAKEQAMQTARDPKAWVPARLFWYNNKTEETAYAFPVLSAFAQRTYSGKESAIMRIHS